MLVEIIVTIATITVFIYGYLRYKFRKFPPGPYGVPIMGYLPFLGPLPNKKYSEIGKTYGKIFSVCLGSLPIVVINDLELIRRAFKSDLFTGRPKSIVAMSIVSNGITFSEGRAWLEQRRFTIKTLKELGFGKSSLSNTIVDDLQTLITYLRTTVGKPIDLKPILAISIMNTIWAIVTGGKFELDDPKALHMHKVSHEGFIEPEVSGVAWFMPFLAQMAPELTGFKNIQYAVHEIRRIFGELYEERQKIFSPGQLNDFVDHYLNEIRDTTDPKSSFYKANGKKNFCDTMLNLFSAGSDTTSTTISWAILYMIKFPKVLERIQTEIHTVIGYERLPRAEDRSRMPYTEATMNEIFRCSSIVPGALLHSTMEDTYFEDYYLPKGTIVMGNLYQVHHDPNYWGPDVEEFKPERFLYPDGRLIEKNTSLVPFSVGKRICPGESLAIINFFLFFIGLLQEFDIKADPASPQPSLEAKPGLVIGPMPYHVILSPRNHTILPQN